MLIKIVPAAIVTGLLPRNVVGLEPVWWLAWLAPAPLPTLYARIGDAFGWLCVAIAIAGAALMISGRRRLRPAAPSVFP